MYEINLDIEYKDFRGSHYFVLVYLTSTNLKNSAASRQCPSFNLKVALMAPLYWLSHNTIVVALITIYLESFISPIGWRFCAPVRKVALFHSDWHHHIIGFLVSTCNLESFISPVGWRFYALIQSLALIFWHWHHHIVGSLVSTWNLESFIGPFCFWHNIFK